MLGPTMAWTAAHSCDWEAGDTTARPVTAMPMSPRRGAHCTNHSDHPLGGSLCTGEVSCPRSLATGVHWVGGRGPDIIDVEVTPGRGAVGEHVPYGKAANALRSGIQSRAGHHRRPAHQEHHAARAYAHTLAQVDRVPAARRDHL